MGTREPSLHPGRGSRDPQAGHENLNSTTVAHFLGGCRQVTGSKLSSSSHCSQKAEGGERLFSKDRKDLHPDAQNVLRDPCASGASGTVSSISSILQTKTLGKT